jgi:cytochrome c oxidase cbb3-type subunit I/II
MTYWLLPRLWNKPLYSTSLANLHFWIGLVGILLYVAAMWTSGITQGLMLNATTENGTILAYPNFLDTLNTIRPLMLMRVIGGALYLTGWLMMGYNVWQTLRGASRVNGTVEVFESDDVHAPAENLSLVGSFFNPPVLFSIFGTGFACAWMFGGDFVSLAGLVGTMVCVVLAFAHYESRGKKWGDWYDRLLVNSLPFTLLTFLAVVAGGLIQIIPTVVAHNASSLEDRKQVPYTPLELAGRDLYIREGCYTCHSQMIRTLVPDVLRYGDYSRLGESIYDHPFQWGSKRNGPDLARVGGKYPNIWHLQHMENPRAISVGSNMPNFPWLIANDLNTAVLPAKISAQRTLGVPYPNWTPEQIASRVAEQARGIAADLRANGAYVAPEKEIIALIAYLQKLGRFEAVAPAAAVAAK